jgi:multiple antibiotic resistance protein
MMASSFWLCFVPLFVAVDAIGMLPIFVGMMGDADRKTCTRAVLISVLTAMCVALAFLFVGEAILRFMGITVGDFMIAGGIILFLISIGDLLTVEKRTLTPLSPEELGPVPLGVPLIVGPAVLTTIMLLVREYGFLATTLATVSNILIAGTLFFFSGFIMKFIGNSGTKIMSKIANLFLAAIAVMMVRKGLILALHSGV